MINLAKKYKASLGAMSYGVVSSMWSAGIAPGFTSESAASQGTIWHIHLIQRA